MYTTKDEIKVHSACTVSEACHSKLRLESYWHQRISCFKNNAFPLQVSECLREHCWFIFQALSEAVNHVKSLANLI